MGKVQVTRVGERIHARFAYSAVDNEIAEQAGGRWAKSANAWTFKLSMEMCHDLRAAFGDRLEIMPPLREWASAVKATRAELESLRDLEVPADALARLQERAPGLYAAVASRPYQIAGAAFLGAAGSALLGDQPGLGKTYQAMAAIGNSTARRILVTCPRTATKSVWESKVEELLGDSHCAYLAQGSREYRQSVIELFNANAEEYPDWAHVLIVNTEMIRVRRERWCLVMTKVCWSDVKTRKEVTGDSVLDERLPSKWCRGNHTHEFRYFPEYPELFAKPWDMIVMDESHHALASTANKQSKGITQVRLGAVRLPVHGGTAKIAMSGTPYRSKAVRAWGTLNWLRPKEFSSYWAWAKRYFEVKDGEYAMTVAKMPKDEQEFRDAMRPYLLARTKQEVASELPPIEYAGSTSDGSEDGYKAIWLDMEPKQARAYAQMRKMASAEIRSGKVTAVGVLATLTRLRQFACSYASLVGPQKVEAELPSCKFDWIADFLSEREGFDGKVIIASQFTGLLKVFRAELAKRGYDPLMLTGETSDRGRYEFQQKIQNPDDPHWIGLINTRAGGEAITLDQADDMILVDPPWIDDEVRQVEDRVHRISRIHQVTVYRLLSRGTVEQNIAELTQQQRADMMSLRPAGRKILEGMI